MLLTFAPLCSMKKKKVYPYPLKKQPSFTIQKTKQETSITIKPDLNKQEVAELEAFLKDFYGRLFLCFAQAYPISVITTLLMLQHITFKAPPPKPTTLCDDIKTCFCPESPPPPTSVIYMEIVLPYLGEIEFNIQIPRIFKEILKIPCLKAIDLYSPNDFKTHFDAIYNIKCKGIKVKITKTRDKKESSGRRNTWLLQGRETDQKEF